MGMGGIDKSDQYAVELKTVKFLEKSCIPPHIENHYKCIHMLHRKQQYYWIEDNSS